MEINKNTILALATIVGTTVGAGIFGIPYVIVKAGLLAGFFNFILIGGAVLLLHLLFGEVVLRTKTPHRLIGYAQIYLGAWGRILITISTVVGLVGALLAYLIIGGDFLHMIFGFLWEAPSFYWSLLFWASLSVFVFLGIKFIAPLEVLMNTIFIGIILFIFFVALPKINFQDIALFDPPNTFLPYGILLFAFAGWLAVPEAVSILSSREEKSQLKAIIIWSAILVFILYFLFTFVVVGVGGQNTSEDALSGLVPYLGHSIVVLGAIFGVVAVAASFLVLGNYLKNALRYDYSMPAFLAASFATGLPLLFFLAGFREFIAVIGLTGVLIGVLEGVVIILIFQRAKKFGDREPEYALNIPQIVLYFLAILFIVGAVSYFRFF